MDLAVGSVERSPRWPPPTRRLSRLSACNEIFDSMTWVGSRCTSSLRVDSDGPIRLAMEWATWVAWKLVG